VVRLPDPANATLQEAKTVRSTLKTSPELKLAPTCISKVWGRKRTHHPSPDFNWQSVLGLQPRFNKIGVSSWFAHFLLHTISRLHPISGTVLIRSWFVAVKLPYISVPDLCCRESTALSNRLFPSAWCLSWPGVVEPLRPRRTASLRKSPTCPTLHWCASTIQGLCRCGTEYMARIARRNPLHRPSRPETAGPASKWLFLNFTC